MNPVRTSADVVASRTKSRFPRINCTQKEVKFRFTVDFAFRSPTRASTAMHSSTNHAACEASGDAAALKRIHTADCAHARTLQQRNILNQKAHRNPCRRSGTGVSSRRFRSRTENALHVRLGAVSTGCQAVAVTEAPTNSRERASARFVTRFGPSGFS